jgi:hypothetical protein
MAHSKWGIPVGHEDQSLWAWAPRACLAQQPKSISATRPSTFSTVLTGEIRGLEPVHIYSSLRVEPLLIARFTYPVRHGADKFLNQY